VSDPSQKRPDPTRPAAQGAKGNDSLQSSPPGQIPVARRIATTPPKSSEVISKSYRVVELPPPPVIAPPIPIHEQPDNEPPQDRLPDNLVALPEHRAAEPTELGALQIRESPLWTVFRRRVRMSPRWERWLADPERRNRVGMTASVVAQVVLIALWALVLRAPTQTPLAERIDARDVLPPGSEMTVAGPQPALTAPEPIVRLVAPGSLESLGLDPPDDWVAPVSDLEATRQETGADGPLAKIEPPANSPADPAELPKPQPHRDEPLPGMADGSQLPSDLLQAIDRLMQGKYKRRTPDGRGEGVRYTGGTPKSEEAVELALHWLAAHQRPDGSWSFNHVGEACQHYCTHPGSEASTTASTGMALLPFLGAGDTHKEGDYKDVVQRGLNYLKARGIRISYGNDLRDGSMYGQALATVALCEAYGMTHDADLKEPAQTALDYIAYVQDNHTGGWRYNPGESGDTTVTGWMLMALKSGQMARLNVQSPAIFGAERFLDSVQNQDGSQYGYQSRKPRPATTAVGLLCRMYTGWRRDNPGIIKGVAYLNSQGPSKDFLYYDYYATQVLFHWAGPEWDKWNRKMRENLIYTQDRAGHSAGSWYFESPQSAAGGRLYNTAMATMILEVYYRFMPLYGEEAVEGK
jgi:hypothetical protein